MSIEDPDADKLAQSQPVSYDEVEDAEDIDLGEVPLDADPFDVADQRRSVPIDDDLEN